MTKQEIMISLNDNISRIKSYKVQNENETIKEVKNKTIVLLTQVLEKLDEFMQDSDLEKLDQVLKIVKSKSDDLVEKALEKIDSLSIGEISIADQLQRHINEQIPETDEIITEKYTEDIISLKANEEINKWLINEE